MTGRAANNRSEGIPDMTMLTHAGGPFKPARHSSSARDAAGTGPANARMAMIKRVCVGALTVLIAAGALTGIIVLRTTIYLSRLTH
jgi:hypothetical protein